MLYNFIKIYTNNEEETYRNVIWLLYLYSLQNQII
jgi:hypothetical protein